MFRDQARGDALNVTRYARSLVVPVALLVDSSARTRWHCGCLDTRNSRNKCVTRYARRLQFIDYSRHAHDAWLSVGAASRGCTLLTRVGTRSSNGQAANFGFGYGNAVQPFARLIDGHFCRSGKM